MSKKMTKVEMFKSLLANYTLTDNEIEFINHEIELLEKKNGSRKPTKVQVENEFYKTEILKALENGKSYGITEMLKNIPALAELTNQKVSAIVRQMKNDGLIVRTEIKGKAWFSLA